ncbi:hypothetical protein ACLBOM_25545 [Escherichia coli]
MTCIDMAMPVVIIRLNIWKNRL